MVEGDETLGVPTVDPRQGKKFTRAGRKKSGRKPRQPSGRGRHTKKQLSIQEEVDNPVLFEVPDVAKINPTHEQLHARHEDGYAIFDREAAVDAGDELPTDMLGEDNVQPEGGGAVPMANVETYDEYIAPLVNSHDEPITNF